MGTGFSHTSPMTKSKNLSIQLKLPGLKPKSSHLWLSVQKRHIKRGKRCARKIYCILKHKIHEWKRLNMSRFSLPNTHNTNRSLVNKEASLVSLSEIGLILSSFGKWKWHDITEEETRWGDRNWREAHQPNTRLSCPKNLHSYSCFKNFAFCYLRIFLLHT